MERSRGADAGRVVEIDTLIGSVIELGELTGIATPSIDAVHALTSLLNRIIQDEKGCVQLRKAA